MYIKECHLLLVYLVSTIIFMWFNCQELREYACIHSSGLWMCVVINTVLMRILLVCCVTECYVPLGKRKKGRRRKNKKR